jgi:hypothetical protein
MIRGKKQPRIEDVYRDVRQARRQSTGLERLTAEIESRLLQRQQRQDRRCHMRGT